MAPAARDTEIAELVSPSETDVGSSQGSSRKYAVAFTMLALVAVIVGGIGMHSHARQATEVGDIIEACGDYSVESTCSAASCDWDGVKCNVAKIPKSGFDPSLVQRTGSMRISKEREAAAAINCNSENATADIGVQFSAATAGKSEADIKPVCQEFLDKCPSTDDQTWIQARPRCAGMTPTPAADCTEVGLGAMMAGKAESEMTAVCQAFANACPAAASIVAARPRCVGVTPAPATPAPATTAPCTEAALGEQMAGKPESEMTAICQAFLTACPAASSVVTGRPRCAGVTR